MDVHSEHDTGAREGDLGYRLVGSGHVVPGGNMCRIEESLSLISDPTGFRAVSTRSSANSSPRIFSAIETISTNDLDMFTFPH